MSKRSSRRSNRKGNKKSTRLNKGTKIENGYVLTRPCERVEENGMVFYVDTDGTKYPDPETFMELMKANTVKGGIMIINGKVIIND